MSALGYTDMKMLVLYITYSVYGGILPHRQTRHAEEKDDDDQEMIFTMTMARGKD